MKDYPGAGFEPVTHREIVVHSIHSTVFSMFLLFFFWLLLFLCSFFFLVQQTNSLQQNSQTFRCQFTNCSEVIVVVTEVLLFFKISEKCNLLSVKYFLTPNEISQHFNDVTFSSSDNFLSSLCNCMYQVIQFYITA